MSKYDRLAGLKEAAEDIEILKKSISSDEKD